MTLSPCQRHRAKVKAAQVLDAREALTSSPVSFHLQLNELKRDVERLRSLPTIADRVEMKRLLLLPRWLPTVEAYLAGDRRFDNPVFAYCVVWLMDAGEMERALDWADIAIAEGQKTPENIKSAFPAFIADSVMEWAVSEAAAGHSIEPYFSRTFNNIRDKWRLHEEINAKWFKFAGLYLLRDANGKSRATAVEDVETLDAADRLLAQAEKYNKNAGVKTVREKINARIRSLTEQ
ncbi:phage terminase small subunit [Erwinia pyrifoliae]|uniref:Phage terminase small subunit n=1 Tax=Erwinia pyrifoliae TaxID=79967 RepID=A0ABY5XCV4_ERWPY|nr:phage terminase small subunit [Erwinia pyrifoliae]MCT2387309.1 phage terminase small subunit [Erwinia pyrifoliae]MCU8587091.1 phage terminase small subunit [Erwinia pyrifoliae]UWS30954.1 phage terminase small subunit [Erwinia pyrifoliae]UWS35248.1 phage terminase small subunit [Erwinia pyrifoliae]